jgi:hypothetical protein
LAVATSGGGVVGQTHSYSEHRRRRECMLRRRRAQRKGGGGGDRDGDGERASV